MDIFDFIVSGTAIGILILSAGYLFIRDNRPGKTVGFASYVLAAFVILMGVFEIRRMYLEHPGLMYINQPLELFLGPLSFLYLTTRIKGKVSPDRITCMLFIPGILAVIWFFPFFFRSAEEKFASVDFVNYSQPSKAIYLFFMYSAMPYFIVCLLLIVVYAYSVLGKKSFAHHVRMHVIIAHSLVWISIAAAVYFTNMYSRHLALDMTLFLIEILLILFYYLDMRYSDFFDLIVRDVREVRYQRSHINGLDTRAVVFRLKELMELDRLFADDQLSLRTLSEKLGVTPHQLSEILNTELRMNFKTFVNSYRIDEAKKRLTENRDGNILNLAFECGFNSKTVFNTTFVRIVGRTPTEYRNECMERKS
jgi:AraC-like DNA-binding protein